MSDPGNAVVPLFQLAVRCSGRTTVVVPLVRFPFTVGRAGSAGLVLDVPGIWDRHLRFELDPREGLFAVTEGKALVRHGGELIRRHRARNGDEYQAGSVTLQVSLGEPDRQGLGFWEGVLWVLLIVVGLLQLAVAWSLLVD